MSVHTVLTQEENTPPPFSGKPSEKSLNGRLYPSWWPVIKSDGIGANRLEMLHGFPFLSFWAIESGGFPQMPPFPMIEYFTSPSQQLLDTLPELERLETLWLQASKLNEWDKSNGSWLEIIGKPAADFWDKNHQIWESYLFVNCLPQLQFFGVPYKGYESKVFNNNSSFFKEPLGYFPGKWILMVNFSLMIIIKHKMIQPGDSPFREWMTAPQDLNLDPLLNEKSLLSFPICKWVANNDINQMKLMLKSIGWRGITRQDYRLDDQFIKDEKLQILLCFRDFYENGGFNEMTEREVRITLSNSSLRTLYCLMIKRIRSTRERMISISSMNKPFNIYNNNYANFVSSTDFILWSLMVLYIEFTSIENRKKFVGLKVNPDYLRASFIAGKQLVDAEKSNRELAKTAAADFEREVERKRQWNINEREELKKQWDKNDEISLKGSPVEPPITMNDPKLKNFLNEYRILWRNTALYHLFESGDQIWPILIKNIFEKDTFEYKIVEFMRNYPPRRLRIPRFNFLEWKRLDTGWESAFKDQYYQYLTWVNLNVQSQDEKFYSPPGTQLKGKDGKYLFIQDENGTQIQVINTYPDIMLKPEDSNSQFQTSKIISILFISIDQIAKAGWGDDWVDFVNQFGKKMWERVKEALIEIVKAVKAVVDEVLPEIGPYLLLGLTVFGAILIGGDFIDAKIKKNA